MGRFRARCKLGFDLNTQVHHCRDEPGIVWGCHLSRDLNRPAHYAVTRTRRWMSLSAKPPGSTLVLASSTLALPSTTNRVAIVLSLSASFPWPARLRPRSAPPSHNAAAPPLLPPPPSAAVGTPVSRAPRPPPL